MVVLFVLLWFSTWFAIAFWIIQFLRLKENERIKAELERIGSLKGLDKFKYKIKNILKKQEQPEIKPIKFTEKQLKKYIIVSVIIFVVSFVGIVITASQVENSSSDNTLISEKISYRNEVEFEKELNSGNTEMKGKIIKFKVLEYKPKSLIGVNCLAGEHLNFISDSEINAKKDDIIIAKIIDNPTSSLGSWYIHYEKLAESNEIVYDTDKKQDEETEIKHEEEQEKNEENNTQIQESNNISNTKLEKQEIPENHVTESQKIETEQNVSSNSSKNDTISKNTNSNTKTTTSSQSESTSVSANTDTSSSYILNTNTKKFHYPSCSSVKKMSDKNKQEFNGSRNDVISKGYDPCQICHP